MRVVSGRGGEGKGNTVRVQSGEVEVDLRAARERDVLGDPRAVVLPPRDAHDRVLRRVLRHDRNLRAKSSRQVS